MLTMVSYYPVTKIHKKSKPIAFSGLVFFFMPNAAGEGRGVWEDGACALVLLRSIASRFMVRKVCVQKKEAG